MAIQENWDNSHFADYLLYGLWPPVKAWALLAGFDWHEDVDSEPELISFHNEGEEGYKDEMRFHEAEKRIYYKKKKTFVGFIIFGIPMGYMKTVKHLSIILIGHYLNVFAPIG